MAHQDIPDTTRDARLEARVSVAQKSLMQRPPEPDARLERAAKARRQRTRA